MGSLSTMERMLESLKNGEEKPKEFPPPSLPCRPLGKARRLPSYVTRFQSHSSQARVSLDRVPLKVLVTEDSEIGEEKVSNGVEDSEIGEEKVSNGVEDSEIGEEEVSNGVEDSETEEEKVSNGVEDSEIGEEEVSIGVEVSEIGEEEVSNGVEDSEIAEEEVSNGVEDSEIGEEKVSNGAEDSEIGEEKVSNGAEDSEIEEEEVSNEVEDSEIGEEKVSNGVKDSEIGEEKVSNGLGLISLMDEESVISQGNDLTLVNKLSQHLCICVCIMVVYDATGFLEINRDSVHSDLLLLLYSLLLLFALNICKEAPRFRGSLGKLNGTECKRPCTATKFKGQLFKLLHSVENTSQHFICCIKPNRLQLLGVFDVVRMSKVAYHIRMTHERYGFLLPQNITTADAPSVCIAILNRSNIPHEMYQVGFTKLFAIKEYLVVKERHQAAITIQKELRCRSARKSYARTLEMAIPVKAVTSGWLARIHTDIFQQQLQTENLAGNIPAGKYVRDLNPGRRNEIHPEQKQSSEHAFQQASTLQFQPLFSTDFQNPLLALDAALREKEDENAVLRQRLQQYETKWIEYETKMLSMKEMWQKQILSLQMRLAAATMKNLAADEVLIQQMKYEESTLRASDKQASVTRHNLPHDNGEFDLEDTASMGAKTPKSNINSGKVFRHSDSGQNKKYDATRSAVSHLLNEFEQRKHVFNDDARFRWRSSRVRQKQTFIPMDSKNWSRFKIWKKAFKVRLQETKTALQKLGNTEPSEKTGREWWGERISWLSQCAGIQT